MDPVREVAELCERLRKLLSGRGEEPPRRLRVILDASLREAENE